MSLPWTHRKERLATLLKTTGNNEDEDSVALDRVLHGHSVIGKTGMRFAPCFDSAVILYRDQPSLQR